VPPAYRPPIGARVCWPTRNASAGPVTIGPSKEKSRPVESVWRYTGSVAPRRSRERSSMPGVQMTSAKAPFVRYWLWFVPRRALLPRPPPGATPRQRRKAPYSFARRRLARPMEAALRVFASHGCVFRALHRRVKGQKCTETCTVRSLFFRRPSGPSAVGSDLDQPGVPTRPREGGTFARSESHSGYRGQNAA
jgi:hypothetical protein